ncbi:hypothetical protein [Sulfobacillus thermosulfidooxidans]|uniref:hypothetical protein n=1 Tax=Sulfobacillus thermosulfidooxidans TaxID=28034 RepID=UPI0012FDF054|nr:hypothetical protein [Sulfobacillus thermosulfidooxidans]
MMNVIMFPVLYWMKIIRPSQSTTVAWLNYKAREASHAEESMARLATSTPYNHDGWIARPGHAPHRRTPSSSKDVPIPRL